MYETGSDLTQNRVPGFPSHTPTELIHQIVCVNNPWPHSTLFSSLQSNFIREEIRLHLTSNDAIWEAEEIGFCTMLFYLIVSIWRKKGEQQQEGRGREALQFHIWEQRSVTGCPPPLPPHALWRYTAVLPSLFPSPSPFSFSLSRTPPPVSPCKKNRPR